VFSWIETIKPIILKYHSSVLFQGFSDSGFFVNYKSAVTHDNFYEENIKTLVGLVNQ
jgi:hypothetical protein